MKKILIYLLCVNLITFVSFASSAASTESDTEKSSSAVNNVVDAPVEKATAKHTAEGTTTTVTTTTTITTTTAKDGTAVPEKTVPEPVQEKKTENAGISEKSEVENINYPVPDDIENPDIVTLDPETDKSGEDKPKEELVVVDLPPLSTATPSNPESDKENKQVSAPAKKTEQKPVVNKTETEPKTEPKVETKDPVKENISKPAKKTVEPKVEETIDNVAKEPVEEVITEEEIAPAEEPIVPSRSVTLKNKEYLDVYYPGMGWIYTGITDGSKDMSYFGRDLGTKNTKFTLQARVPGTKILHFCKNDYIKGIYLDDYLEVIILPEEGSNKTHVEAPAYKQPVPKAVIQRQKAEAERKIAEEAAKAEAELKAQEAAKAAANTKKETSAQTAKKPSGAQQADTQQTQKNNQVKHTEKATDTEKIPGATDYTNPVNNQNNITGNNNKTDISSGKQDVPFEESPEITYKPYEETNQEQDSIYLAPGEYDGVIIPEEEVVETSENSDVMDCNTLLNDANFLYNEKEFEAAYEKVNKYLEYATINIDSGLLLKGQILEAKSDMQDIKGAISIYNTLMEEFPASPHWEEANKRVIYLKRFYLEVR